MADVPIEIHPELQARIDLLHAEVNALNKAIAGLAVMGIEVHLDIGNGRASGAVDWPVVHPITRIPIQPR